MISLWIIDANKRILVKVIHTGNKERIASINTVIECNGGHIVGKGEEFELLIIDDEFNDVSIPEDDYNKCIAVFCLSVSSLWQVTNLIQALRIKRYDRK